ncbi:hypothetical protein O9992_22570 [Vibrio lentus]|nr:hypothetical protein [Vibrio lentus]
MINHQKCTPIGTFLYRTVMPIQTSHETELLEARFRKLKSAGAYLWLPDALDDTVDAVLKNIFKRKTTAIKFVVGAASQQWWAVRRGYHDSC